MTRHTKTAALATATAIAALAAVASASAELPTSARCSDDAILVFDASGSMARLADGGSTRISLAREAARHVVPAAANVRRLGLVVYGPGAGDACRNFELRVAPVADAAAPILAEIEATSTSGETPLTDAVESAAETLRFRERAAVVVLLTDGDENCGGDPCGAARRLKSEARELTVHVVGFKLGTAPRFRAACLAEETGGLFVPTQTLDELVTALEQTLTCSDIASR